MTAHKSHEKHILTLLLVFCLNQNPALRFCLFFAFY